jgi:peptidoglycan/xylan/chitin deacetylase (PgdA/CDA1 family)
MSERWNWDFEDEPATRKRPVRLPLRPPRPGGAARGPLQPVHPRTVQVRRRRFGAAVVAIALLVLLVVVLSGSHARTTASGSGSGRGVARAQSRTPTDPEQDERTAVASVLAYTPYLRAGSGRSHDVALTFDDGPGPYTPGVLSVLERMHVRATFFVIGRMLRYFGSSTVREIEDGDVVGDHTENHPMLAQMSAHEQHEELLEQILRVEALGGHRPLLFRPPYGSFNATTYRELRALHLLMVLWSADTGDYQQPGVEAIVQSALAAAHPGAIILMHDGGGDRSQTIAALPAIIEGLRKRDLNIVTVPRLLIDEPPPANQAPATNLSGD